ncbi:MAG: hypothetical protein ACOCXH_04370 [Cyclobacteriaceae bacterium]
MKKSLKILTPFIVILVLCSCYDNSDCFTENGDKARVEFITDSASYTFDLPLNPMSDTAAYLIDTIVNAPITVIYQSKQRLLHPECGMETVYEIDTALTPLTNNVRIVKKEVIREMNNSLTTNIEVVL